MGNQKGKMQYVPYGIIDELEDIKREDKLNNNADAFREMVKYTRVARELKRLMRLNWGKARKRTPVEKFSFKVPELIGGKKYKRNKNVTRPIFDF